MDREQMPEESQPPAIQRGPLGVTRMGSRRFVAPRGRPRGVEWAMIGVEQRVAVARSKRVQSLVGTVMAVLRSGTWRMSPN